MRWLGTAFVIALAGCSPSGTTSETPAPQMKPDDPTVPATDDDYAARVATVRAFIEERAPSSELNIVVEPPFVVVGDESPRRVKERATGTVRWGVRRLKRAFFDRDPTRDLTIWLFNGEASYRRHTRALWNENPDTPYGYYSARTNALVMNIATGGGTLIHELVHPFVEANFPGSPAWFNEGLGSLFEQSRDKNGEIAGLPNWRLPGLQASIHKGSLIGFEKLMGLDENQFYGAGSGSHYAQARYLLYYLQEKGLLRSYYRAFVRDAGEDPSGFETLKDILDRDDIVAFQREWESWVLSLRFDG